MIEYRIEARARNTREPWHHYAGPYQSEDDARVAFADAERFPLTKEYRVIRVEVVFT